MNTKKVYIIPVAEVYDVQLDMVCNSVYKSSTTTNTQDKSSFTKTNNEIVSYFEDNLIDWFFSTEKYDCCTKKDYSTLGLEDTNLLEIQSTLDSYRQNFEIPSDEEILFTRDTSFWNKRNEGLVMTDKAIYVIHNSGTPPVKIYWSSIHDITLIHDDCFTFNYGANKSCRVFKNDFFKNGDGKSMLMLVRHLNAMVRLAVERENHAQEIKAVKESSIRTDFNSEEDIRSFEEEKILPILSNIEEDRYKSAMYDVIAYINYKGGKKNEAIEAINKSIQFCDAPNAHATKGVIMAMGEERTAHDKYKALQELVKYKEEDGIPYWATDGEMDKILEDQTFSFANAFLSIPYRQRKFIVISDQDYVMLPDNLKVVPNKYLPTEMQFTEGHPVVGEIYVCHPYHENFYLPIDSYQIELFRDELGEIRYLLQCLGAKSIEIEDKNCKEESSMNGNSMGGHVHGEYKGIGGGVSGSYSDEQDKFQKAINDCFVNQNFRRLKEKPHIPEGLVWYPHRKSWQDLVRQLELGNLDSHHVTISTSDCLQVSEKESSSLEIEVKALIAAGGIGGNYDTSTSFKSEANKSWTLKVDFYPNEEEEKQLVQQEPTHLLGVAKNKTGNKMKWLVYGLIALIIILGAIIAALLL